MWIVAKNSAIARQGAPSTIRCIETCPPVSGGHHCLVREHPAPSGALRHRGEVGVDELDGGQGAPSTIRCIETCRPAPFRRSGSRSGGTQHHQVH